MSAAPGAVRVDATDRSSAGASSARASSTGGSSTGGEVASPGRLAFDDILPFAVALIPFGLAIGGTSAAIGLSGVSAVFGTVVLLSGAAQLAALEVLDSGGGVLSVALIAGLVNLRFVFYGAGVADWFADRPLRTRLLLAFPIVDQTFMLCQRRFDEHGDPTWRQRYYLVATVLLAGVFVLSQVIGFNVGANMPAWLGLHLAAPLAFAGMLATAIGTRRDLVAGAVAAVVVVGGGGVLGAVTLPLAVVAGVVCALRVPLDADGGEAT